MHFPRSGRLLLLLLALLFGSHAVADDSPGGRRIVGGVATTIDKHPWQVALNIKGADGKAYLCGGSLITQKWVLTAAHCFKAKSTESTRLKAGVTDYVSSGSWLAINRLVVHPAYNSKTFENDIALIKLKSEHPSGGIALAGDATVLTGRRLDVTGYGATSEGGAGSSRLMLATVPYVENAACNEKVALGGLALATMICAGEKAGGVDACQGDSGGPLVLRAADGPVLVGIVSNGIGCARKLKYGLYTRVSSFRQWISDVMKEN